jgi:protein-arginine kinase activator protein McsA
MIKIFNKKLDIQINIGNVDWVTFTPRDYEEVPNVIIEFKNGFNFFEHAENCTDCGRFFSDFGSKTFDWYIEYMDKVKRLDLSTLDGKEYYNNKIQMNYSLHTFGTTMKLIIHSLSTDTADIEKYKEWLIENEDYETACLLRDLHKID